MKHLSALILIAFSLAACNRKEDAPPPHTPHVAGAWSGNGTDNTIGYYEVSMDLFQEGTSVSGTFHTASSYGTSSGEVRMTIQPGGGNNLASVTMTRTTFTGSITCSGTMTLARPTSMTEGRVTIPYNVTDCNYPAETGGLNMRKDAGTN